MVIYLDSMIFQYIADNIDYILAIGGYLSEDALDLNSPQTHDPKLLGELRALGYLAFLEQLGNDWCFAATPHLLEELRSGRPTSGQTEFYDQLESTWQVSGWMEVFPYDPQELSSIDKTLLPLELSKADRLHLAFAIQLGATWFLTNDSEIIRKCYNANLPIRVRRPSECLDGLSVGLFLRTDSY